MASFGTLLMLLVCALAWFKGAQAERHGALLLATTWLVTEILYRVLTYSAPLQLQMMRAELTLTADGVLAIGFLVLAIRHSSLWLGAELIVQGATFTLHSLFMSLESGLKAYFIAINLFSFLLLLILLSGTMASWSARASKRRSMKQSGYTASSTSRISVREAVAVT